MLHQTLAQEFLSGHALPLPIIAVRLLGAALLCAVLGYEREAAARAAGLRTHILVGVAAATYSVITLELIADFGTQRETIRMDPVRLIEAVTGGVAFLAAGMIVLTRGRVRNLTTGALMWLAAAIGVAAGNGLWAIAALATLLGLATAGLRAAAPLPKPGPADPTVPREEQRR